MAFLFDAVLDPLLDARRLSRVQDNEKRYRSAELKFTLSQLFERLSAIVGQDIQGATDSPLQAHSSHQVRGQVDSTDFQPAQGNSC